MKNYQIGFVQGHSYLTEKEISQIKETLNPDGANGREWIIKEFERRMSEAIGQGYGISFASARMAFFSLLKILNIGPGDEVILLGFSCSVMANAVFRLGATPVFSDVDSDTFGSQAVDIKKKITSRTKVIVAQHSFGIPCAIQETVDLAKKNNIFLIEDCAITFDSSVNGVKVGNWGNAAIFSTGHDKALNTLIGGLLYTQNGELYSKIKIFAKDLPDLNSDHQERLYRQFIFERKNYRSRKFFEAKLVKSMHNIIKNLIKTESAFLEEDYRRQSMPNSSYPYPAKMPLFLAKLGLFELGRWPTEKTRRKKILNEYLNIISESNLNRYLPKAYFNQSLDIVPLRFVFQYPDSGKLIKQMSRFIDVDGIWFRAPIICCPDGPESLGYHYGDCPISERVGAHIINWPCVISEEWEPEILRNFNSLINRNNHG